MDTDASTLHLSGRSSDAKVEKAFWQPRFYACLYGSIDAGRRLRSCMATVQKLASKNA